jgi:folate-binding protein YgfZ
VAGAAIVAARPRGIAPFALELQVPADHATAVTQVLVQSGARELSAAALQLARILAGWPRLLAEIDQKTLPQEARFDEIDGVSYTKGCYTGQETVARVHFRGHANRGVTGLTWTGTPDFSTAAVVTQDQREIGWVTSAAWIPTLEVFVGLAKVRRETDRDRPVTACGVAARLTPLPFGFAG